MKLSDKLQKLQNRAARVLTYSSFDTDASLLLESLGWKNLSTQHNLQKALLVYKSIHGLARPEYLLSKFVNHNNITPYSLHDSANKLAVPLPHKLFS